MRQQERRREMRVRARGVRARVRAGHKLVLVDISSAGALVEASCQLRPGSRIDVHLESDVRREIVGAQVVRCTVDNIDALTGITYRAALSFIHQCEWVRETTTRQGYEMPHELTSDDTGGDGNETVIPDRVDLHVGNKSKGPR